MFRSKTCRFRDKRLLKLRNTLNDPQNYLKHLTAQVSCIYWILIPEAQISLRFAYGQPFSRYRIVENQKCTRGQWPQNDPRHLTVKSTLYILNTHPRGPNFTPFCSMTSRFWDTRLLKIGNAPNDLEWPQALNRQKYPVYTEYTHLRFKFQFQVSLCDHPFSRYKVVENHQCSEWTQNDHKHLTVQSTL